MLFLCQEVTRGGFSTRVSLFSPSLPVDVTLPAGIERSTKGQRNMQDEPELEKKTCVGKGEIGTWGGDEGGKGGRSDDFLAEGEKKPKNCLPAGGGTAFVYWSSPAPNQLLGCADNRSELRSKDKRDPGDESQGKVVIRLLWFIQPL